MESEPLPDNVLRFPASHAEEINGNAIDLGRSSLEELVLLEGQYSERFDDAQLEMLVVQDVLGKRSREEPLS